jgi:transposase InsO family protein
MSRHCQNLGQHDYPTGVERVLTLRAIGVADQDIVRFSSELKEQNNHDVYKMNAREYHDILEETRPKRGPILYDNKPYFNDPDEDIEESNIPCETALLDVSQIPQVSSFPSYQSNTTTLPTPIDHIVHIPIESTPVVQQEANVYRLSQEKYKLISSVHRTSLANNEKSIVGLLGHGGVDATLRKLNQLLEAQPHKRPKEGWKNMREDVANFIRKCPCCQKMGQLKRAIITKPYNVYKSQGLWDQLAIDTIGPLPKSEDGYKYILTLIDTFSRFLHVLPLKDLEGITAAKALISHIGLFGVPNSILTDNGSQFVNQWFDQLLEIIQIDHPTIHAYSHEEASIVERSNKEIVKHLKAILFDTKVIQEWTTFLPLVQRIMNSSYHRAIGMSPVELIYGTTLDLNRGLLTPYTAPTGNLSSWVLKQTRSQHVAIQTALETQTATDLHHIQAAYKKTLEKGKSIISETDFPMGSYVIIEMETGPASKLHSTLRGPMRVIAKQPGRRNLPAVYSCLDLVTHKTEDFLVKQMQPFHFDTEYIDPRKISTTDTQMFDVAEVLGYEFTSPSKLKTDLKLHIKWDGYHTPTWEPYINLQKVDIVIKFMKANRLSKYIPAGLK